MGVDTLRKSEEAFRRAKEVMPGGDTRHAQFYPPFPVALERGEGSFLWDFDGNRYIDLIYNYTSLVHGNAFPPVVKAATQAISNGSAWPAPGRAQIELAELLIERLPSVEMVRFTNSGTESGMLAAQLARIATGRPLILKSRVSYHGFFDDLLVGRYSDSPNDPFKDRPTVTAEFGDEADFARVLSEQGDQVAAVFLEPVAGGGGVAAAPVGFLSSIIDKAHSVGALVVLDEVITLRLSTGGAQQLWGLAPDITMMGKIIGGGFPMGAIGGRADLIEMYSPLGGGPRAPHSGTFNGNPVSTAAGLATLQHLQGADIDRIDGLMTRLSEGLVTIAREAGVPFSIRSQGSIANVYFTETLSEPSYAPRPDARQMADFHRAALAAGVYLSPRGMICTATSLTEDLVEEVLERLGRAFAEISSDS